MGQYEDPLREIESLRQQNSAQLAELEAISSALGTSEGHSSVTHLLELRQQLAAMEDKYLVEKGMRRLNSGEAESMRQQLDAAHELIRLIFESTPPYHEDGTGVFSDAVIEKWKELLP